MQTWIGRARTHTGHAAVAPRKEEIVEAEPADGQSPFIRYSSKNTWHAWPTPRASPSINYQTMIIDDVKYKELMVMDDLVI